MSFGLAREEGFAQKGLDWGTGSLQAIDNLSIRGKRQGTVTGRSGKFGNPGAFLSLDMLELGKFLSSLKMYM